MDGQGLLKFGQCLREVGQGGTGVAQATAGVALLNPVAHRMVDFDGSHEMLKCLGVIPLMRSAITQAGQVHTFGPTIAQLPVQGQSPFVIGRRDGKVRTTVPQVIGESAEQPSGACFPPKRPPRPIRPTAPAQALRPARSEGALGGPPPPKPPLRCRRYRGSKTSAGAAPANAAPR